MEWPNTLASPWLGRSRQDEHGEGGGLAGAVGAEQAEDFAWLHGEAGAIHGVDGVGGARAAEGFVESLNFNRGSFHFFPQLLDRFSKINHRDTETQR